MPIGDHDAFTAEEVRLALRNPGMPLEALQRPVTPIAMHYLLVHFDVPVIDDARHEPVLGGAPPELVVDGRVRRPLALSMDDVRARPAVSMPIVMECAGTGRAH